MRALPKKHQLSSYLCCLKSRGSTFLVQKKVEADLSTSLLGQFLGGRNWSNILKFGIH